MHIQDQGIYSFIETKVREVCLHEIEKLKSGASSSYANETISSLQKENDTPKQRLQELESRHRSMQQEATILIDENKSLMTAIRLLNNELQTVLKEWRPDKKKWQIVGAKEEKSKTKENKERRPNANDPNDNENSMSEKVQTTPLIGDSMIKDIQGTQLGKAVGHRVVVKSFSGATTKTMKDYPDSHVKGTGMLVGNFELNP